MKRLIIFTAACLILAANSAVSAFASESDSRPPSPVSPRNEVSWRGSNVTITVVIPDSTVAPAPETTPVPVTETIKMYPVDVTETIDGNIRQIVKTYELNPHEKPDDIPRADFDRSGWRYTLTDILRKETARMETREHIEAVTLNTDEKEIEKILPLLAPAMDFAAEDGFVGILALDVASIKVESAGTKTTRYTMSVTREYPRLSANDTELVPKTVEEKGKTYHLAGIEWRAGNYSTVDYERITDYYTAVASYTATDSSTKVTGYITTAEYKGTLSKLVQGRAVYTAYFLGEEIRTPLEIVNQPGGLSAPPTANPAEQPTQPTATPTPEATVTPADTPLPTDTPVATDEPIVTDEPAPSDSDDEGETQNMKLLVAIPVLGAIAGIAYFIFKKRREETGHA